MQNVVINVAYLEISTVRTNLQIYVPYINTYFLMWVQQSISRYVHMKCFPVQLCEYITYKCLRIQKLVSRLLPTSMKAYVHIHITFKYVYRYIKSKSKCTVCVRRTCLQEFVYFILHKKVLTKFTNGIHKYIQVYVLRKVLKCLCIKYSMNIEVCAHNINHLQVYARCRGSTSNN